MKKYNGTEWVDTTLRQYKTATDTLTTLPVDIYADGSNATVGISGNTVQNGTPTPDNPIMPQGTGERTDNLFNASLTQGVWAGNAGESPYVSPSTRRICISNIINLDSTKTYTVAPRQPDMYILVKILDSNGNIVSDSGWKSNVKISNAYGIVATFRFANESEISPQDFMGAMLNEGSAALPYEPYGIKIPISSANTTTPVYLGEVETTRRVKKLVLDGTENWFLSTAQAGRFGLSLSDYLKSNGTITSFCSHYMAIAQKSGGTVPNNSQYFYSGSDAARYLFIVDTNCSTAADFKSYLAAQYSAGTPVTVWYVLATETTGIVNEPLMKIGDYADTVNGITVPTITGKDTFDVETTLKPSEASLSYTGWHDAEVEEWDGSQWNE